MNKKTLVFGGVLGAAIVIMAGVGVLALGTRQAFALAGTADRALPPSRSVPIRSVTIPAVPTPTSRKGDRLPSAARRCRGVGSGPSPSSTTVSPAR